MAVEAVADDHHVLALIAGGAPGRWATTCSWWWRLTSAINGNRGGRLSRRIDGIEAAGVPVRGVIERLDDVIEIVDLKQLIPVMGWLISDAGRPANQLAAEAVAAAMVLDTRIQVAQHTPLISELCRHAGIGYTVATGPDQL